MKSVVLRRQSVPWRVLVQRALDGSHDAFYWRVPATGTQLLGVGVADEWRGRGDQTTEAQRWLDSRFDEKTFVGNLPRGWFAATFDGEPGRAHWQGSPGLRVVQPRWLVMQRGSSAEIVLNGTDKADLTAARDEFESWAAGDLAPEVSSEPLGDGQWIEPKADFTERIAAAIAALEQGPSKLVLGNAYHAPLTADQRRDAIDGLLTSAAPGMHFAYSHANGSVLAGCTPETLVRQTGPELAVHVLAGTRARCDDPAEDAARIADLRNNPKDRIEHQIVADGVVQSLGGMVRQLDLAAEPEVLTLRHLHHLERYLWGRVQGGVGLFDLVSALHPTPALAGLPKAEAMAFLADHEPHHRGGFGAPFGWIGGPRHGHVAVAIRSGLLGADCATIFAGAGIVHSSVPERELDEVRAKVVAIARQLFDWRAA